MHTLLASLGETPAVVTECIDELAREGVGIGEVVVLYTKHTLPYFIALKIDFRQGVYEGRIRCRGIELQMDDIRDTRDSLVYRTIVYKSIVEEQRKGRNVHLLISGGRKAMVVDSTLAALAAGLEQVYHVVLPQGYGVLRSELLLPSYNLLSYVESDAPKDLVDKISEVCHPPIKRRMLIRIPLPKLNDEAVRSIVNSMLL